MGFFRSLDNMLIGLQAKILGYDPTKLRITDKAFLPIAFAKLKEASDVAGAIFRTALLITICIFLLDLVNQKGLVGVEYTAIMIGLVVVGTIAIVLSFRVVFFLMGVLAPKISRVEPTFVEADDPALTEAQKWFVKRVVPLLEKVARLIGSLLAYVFVLLGILFIYFLYQLGQSMFLNLGNG